MKTMKKTYIRPEMLTCQLRYSTFLLSGSFDGELADTRHATEADADLAASRGGGCWDE